MSRWLSGGSPDADVLTLEAHAEGAGSALACAYSSSAEFDAALIAARRAAGVYGPRRHRRQLMVSAAALISALVILAFLFRLFA